MLGLVSKGTLQKSLRCFWDSYSVPVQGSSVQVYTLAGMHLVPSRRLVLLMSSHAERGQCCCEVWTGKAQLSSEM